MDELMADQFANDPRIKKAKSLILEALKDHQCSLTGPRDPIPSKSEGYDDLLERCGQLRGGKLFYPYLGSGWGKGALVELADGSVKYDFISGIGPHFWGHSHPKMVAACVDAATSDTVMQGNLQQNEDSVCLMAKILRLAQSKECRLKHCFLTSSGAMANENALKLIFQKKAPASRILCFEKCFSGRTLALAQMTDKAAYRQGLPLTIHVDYLPFFRQEDPKGSLQETLGMLDQHLLRFPDQYAGMCVELIQGEAGYYPGSHDFFRALFERLHREGIAIWADEIQTFGRTSRPFAYQHFGVDADVDLVTIGKLSQICATLFTPDFAPKPGLLSQTFTASASAIASGLVVMDEFLEGDFFGPEGKNFRCHQRFASHLQALADRYPSAIEGPFGLGAMVAFTAFRGDFTKSKELACRLFDQGVICFLAGSRPTRVRFLVPVAAVTSHDIDEVASILQTVVEAMVQEGTPSSQGGPSRGAS